MTLNAKARLLAGASNALLFSLLLSPAAKAEDGGASDPAAGVVAGQGATGGEPPAAGSALREIVVKAKKQAAAKVQLQGVGPLGDRSILDTPMSVSTVDGQLITRIAATTIDAAFNYDASLRPNNSGVASGNTFASRGQTVDLTFGYRYDGLAFPYWFQDQPIESLDGIQVLKGTGGFVYGYASPAGVVNFVSKKPTGELQSSFDISYRSANILRELVDIGGPFKEGGSTAFRLNIVNEQGSLYNGAHNSDRFISLWLQGDLTPKLSWSVNGFYQRTLQTHESNGISLGAGVTHLAPVDGEKFNLGSPSSSKQNDVAQLTGRLNYQISPDWKISGALRYAVLDERFPGNGAQITDNAGDYRLGLLDQNRLFYYYVGQATIDGKFNTGPVQHNIVAGFDYLDDIFDYDYQSYTTTHIPTTTYAFGYTGNIYRGQYSAPSWSSNAAALAYQRPPNWMNKYQEIEEKGVYASDTLTWGPAELLIGGRYTFYDETDLSFAYLNAGGQVVASLLPKGMTDPEVTSVKTFTPVIAPSLRIADGVRIYVSYVQALQTGAIVAAPYLNEGAILAPLKSNQWEVGVKAQRGDWGATLAAFRTTSPSDGANLQNYYEQNGEARYEGIEFDGNYRFNREWLVDLSAAHLEAVQTAAAVGAATPAGAEIPETVRYRATAYVEYTPGFLPGFGAFGGIRYTGDAHGQANNSFYFPSSTVGDVGVSYRLPIERAIDVRANVQNVTDVKYWIPGSTATAISAAAPRTFNVSMAYHFGAGPGDSASGGSGLLGSGHKGWYVRLEGGGLFPDSEDYSLSSSLHPNLNAARGLGVKQNVGGQVSGAIGRDFGLLRTEVEADYGATSLKEVTLNTAAIPINNIDSTSAPMATGAYGDPGGGTTIVAFLGNELINFGGGEQNPWTFSAGAGGGMGVVRAQKWRLQSTDAFFEGDSAVGFAWQALARVQRKLTEHIDLTLSYHYLQVTDVTLRTATGAVLKGDVGDNGLRAGVIYNF